MRRLEEIVLGAAPRWLVGVASRAKAGGRNKMAARRYGTLVSELVPDSTAHDLLVANDDAVVIRVERNGDEPLILKLATSDIAQQQGHLETAALDELAQRSALGEWRSLIAQLQARGTFGGDEEPDGAWFTQSVLPGVPTASLDVDAGELVAHAVAALAPLHSATSSTVMADDVVLHDLVTGPIEMISAWRPSATEGLTAINGECRQRLASLELVVARQHGDYAPSNVLWNVDTGSVSGIVDWKLDMQKLPPETDYVHYAIALLSQRRHIEYGDAVLLMVNDGAGIADRSPVEQANAAGPNSFDLRTAVTLAWLQHVAFGLQKSPDLRSNPIWLTNNVDNVVRGLS